MVLQKVGEFATNILVNGSQEASYTQADDSSYDVGVNSSLSYSEDHQSASAPGFTYDCSVTMPRTNYDYLEIVYDNISYASNTDLHVKVNGSDGTEIYRYSASVHGESGTKVFEGIGGDPGFANGIWVYADSASDVDTVLNVYGRYNYSASHSVSGVSKS
jgi:hypothetical protein